MTGAAGPLSVGSLSDGIMTSAENPDTFIITGDIPAMWLRDSSAQVTPYLHLAGSDSRLRQLLRGLIFRQARSVLLDPYANAFLLNTSLTSPWDSDHRHPPMKVRTDDRRRERLIEA